VTTRSSSEPVAPPSQPSEDTGISDRARDMGGPPAPLRDDTDDDAGAAGDVADVDNDQNRVKRTYSGKVYEEGSLMDTKRDDVI
jgi:hypothetical protein